MTDFFKLKSFDFHPEDVLRKRGMNPGGDIQKYIDSEVLRLCDPKIPKDTGTLINSGILNTQIGSGEVKYRTPYARRLYYHPEYNFSEEKNPEAGGYWFERMKQQHKEDILKGIRARIKEGMR